MQLEEIKKLIIAWRSRAKLMDEYRSEENVYDAAEAIRKCADELELEEIKKLIIAMQEATKR